MYIPKFNREENTEKLVGFMQRYNFATLVSVLEEVPIASHIPVVTKLAGEDVHISGHLARANPHAQVLEAGEMLAIFAGPHAYISPTNYEKRQSVPTWNYVAVHAYGRPKSVMFNDKPEQMRAIVADLVEHHEASYQDQWNELPDKYQNGMMRGVVGFEMVVTKLEGKYKLSQNRPETDQREVARALLSSADASAKETGALMEERLERKD